MLNVIHTSGVTLLKKFLNFVFWMKIVTRMATLAAHVMRMVNVSVETGMFRTAILVLSISVQLMIYAGVEVI